MPPEVRTDDLSKERELRALRSRVVDLESVVATFQGRVVDAITTESRFDEKHGLRCGFHPQVTVSMTTPSVTCTVCGEGLSPLDVLRQFATSERNFVSSLNHNREERNLLRKEIAALKQQRSSLRSQVRKKGGKVPW